MKDKRLVIGVVLIVLGVAGTLYALFGGAVQRSPSADSSTKPLARSYVALGDSVASGLGEGSESDARGCGRTDYSYPNQLAPEINADVTVLACSGATIAEGLRGSQTTEVQTVRPQLERLPAAAPNLITLSIGANDVQWLDLLRDCYQADCGSAAQDATYERNLSQLRNDLAATLKAIRAKYGGRTQLVVIGYYQVFPAPGAQCQDITGLDEFELAWGRDLRDRLNTALSQTVTATGVGTYVEPDFSGHETCSAVPWIQGLTDAAPFHPNKAGYARLAAQLKSIVTQ